MDVLDHRPVDQGSVLHPADHHGRDHVHPAAAQPDAAGPHAGARDEADADHLHLLLPVVPGWSGAVLGCEQLPVDHTAVVHHSQHRSSQQKSCCLTGYCASL